MCTLTTGRFPAGPGWLTGPCACPDMAAQETVTGTDPTRCCKDSQWILTCGPGLPGACSLRGLPPPVCAWTGDTKAGQETPRCKRSGLAWGNREDDAGCRHRRSDGLLLRAPPYRHGSDGVTHQVGAGRPGVGRLCRPRDRGARGGRDLPGGRLGRAVRLQGVRPRHRPVHCGGRRVACRGTSFFTSGGRPTGR